MSQEEADVLIEKLQLAEKYYPYDNKFQKQTNEAFVGYYFNGNYYGIGNHIGSDKVVYDTYNDVCYYIDSLIGVESE